VALNDQLDLHFSRRKHRCACSNTRIDGNKVPTLDHAWGGFTAARGILMSIYFAILAMSLFLVFKPVPSLVFALLLVQVIIQSDYTIHRAILFEPSGDKQPCDISAAHRHFD